MTPAGFWRRFAAHALDFTVLGLFWMLAGVLLFLGITALGLEMPVALADAEQYEPYWNLLTLLVGWLYFALQESSWQQATIGKRLIGIEVSDLAGERISFLRATGRYAASALSYLTLGIGFIMAGFTARRQALHDMVAGTLVVRTPDASTTLGWALFSLVMLLWSGFIAVAVLAGLPMLQEQQLRSSLTAESLAGELAAAAAVSYYARHGELPVSLEDAGYVPSAEDGAPLVSIDPEAGQLVIVARDGSVFLEMVPVSSPDGLAWMCTASPDSEENYPPVCQR